jgi:ABC-2 type transport system permease protein
LNQVSVLQQHRPRVTRRGVFFALLRRDVRVARRELRYFLVRTLMQPVLFLFVFGYLLPKMGFIQGHYATALLPGILAISMAMASLQSVALPMVQDFGFTKEIEDRLLAPVPMALLAIEKIVSGAVQGVFAALVILPLARLIMGPIPGLSLAHAEIAVTVTILGATAFAALGLVLGTVIHPQQMGLLFSIIVAPMIMFGCAYYPWEGLAAVPAIQYAVLVNPLVYVAESLRGALTPGAPHMPLPAAAGAMCVLIAVFCFVGIKCFRRRAMG